MSTPLPTTVTEVRLAQHLTDKLTLDNFDVVQVPLREPGAGEVVVRHDLMQLAAVMPDLMREGVEIPMPPFVVGEPLGAGGVGTVVASNSDDLPVGTTVYTGTWAEYSVGPAEEYWPLDTSVVPGPEYLLNQGTTAYYGMVDIAQVGEGDVVYVSGAAGGVGSLAGQIAKHRGAAKVIGSAGSAGKVAYLVEELGFDAAFDYRDGPIIDQLRTHAPDGITVFFDCVGGEQFEAAVQAAQPNARFALCGALSGQVGGSDGAFPKLDLMTAIVRHLTLRPFACHHTPEQMEAWNTAFATWMGEGTFVYPHTVVDATLAEAPQTLLDYLSGAYKGNTAIRFPQA
ncbi:MAG: NADP-dependent oxidoreductase [Pseudonocardia sp.]|nr:NADP-dependent oxidoreductase [Pseudonocardia sp.]